MTLHVSLVPESDPAHDAGAALRSVALLRVRAPRWVVLGILGWLHALLVAPAIGAAVGFGVCDS